MNKAILSEAPPRSTDLERLTWRNCTAVLIGSVGDPTPDAEAGPRPMLGRNLQAFARLTETFALPTIVLGEQRSFWVDLRPEMSDRAIRVERRAPNAWAEDGLRTALGACGRGKVLLCGASLDNFTLDLAWDLLRGGYEPYVVISVTAFETTLNELATMLRMTQAGVLLVNWGSVASEILEGWMTAEPLTDEPQPGPPAATPRCRVPSASRGWHGFRGQAGG